MNVAALVLAAGSSTRFGAANKLLHDWDGRCLLDRVLDALAVPGIDTTWVVTGHDRDAVERIVARRNLPAIRSLYNEHWQTGLAGSVACGIAAVPDRAAVLVCPGDMPRLNAGVPRTLLRAAAAHPDKHIVVPVHAGRRGNPVLLRRAVFAELLALRGDAGARVLMARSPERVLEVEVGSVGVLQDVDTEAAAQRLQADAGFVPERR